MTGVKFENIPNIVMYLFIEKELRGGISYICKENSKANNKYMKHYDPTKPSQLTLYPDMNNLYGWGMGQYLPYGGFKWLKNVDNFDANSVSKNSSIGYILDVDLEYPDESHELHNDYPLVPEKRAVTCDVLSDYCEKIADEYRIKIGDVKKLIPNLSSKTNYIVHYRNLQLYL